MSKMPSKNIAITGTIGSGKSTVTKYISHYYPTISSDDIVSELYEHEYFRKNINKLLYNKNSSVINKKQLAKDVFENKELKIKLENYIHPIVKEKIKEFLSVNSTLSFVEVPLLFEANFQSLFDKIIVVVSNEEKIIERLKNNRNYTEEEAVLRIANQLSETVKIEKSDYVIKNNLGLKELKLATDKVIKNLEKGD